MTPQSTVRWTIDVDELAEVLHDVMCPTSHHDRPPARCRDWPKYPGIARSAFGRLAARALGGNAVTSTDRPTVDTETRHLREQEAGR